MSNFLNKIPVSPITSFGNPSVPNGSTIGTNFSILQTGGYMEVYTLSGLTYTILPATTGIIEFSGNSIPIQFTKGSGSAFSPDVLTLNSDNISSGRRKLGMLAYVYETNKIYQFRIDNYDTLWNNATGATGPGGPTVVISDFGTTVKNNSAAGVALINAWTASTISGVGGYNDTNASWRVLSTGGSSSGGTFTGGTVTGATIFTNGLTANTFSASTYLGLPIDIRVTGATKSGSVATFTNNTGGTFTLTGLTDVFVTGGTHSLTGGTTTFRNNTGGTFSVSGYTKPSDDIYVNSGSIGNGPSTTNNSITLNRNNSNAVIIENLVDISDTTKLEMDNIIANNKVIKGKTYKIFGCDTLLYYNGIDGKGNAIYTTIYLMGLENDKLTETGVGVFYTPKYDTYSIFTNGQNYSSGDKVIWGGFVWNCESSGTYNSLDIFTLDPSGFVINLPFKDGVLDSDKYNIRYDDIIYDYENDRIIYRNENDTNIVQTTVQNIEYWTSTMSLYNPIKAFQWGNVYNGTTGIGNQRIINSYNENINYTGLYQTNFYFDNLSYQTNVFVDNQNSYQTNFHFENKSYQSNSTLLSTSYQDSLYFTNNSSQDGIEIELISYQKNITLNNNSYQNTLILRSLNTYQNNLNFDNSSYQTNITFDDDSYQQNFSFNNSSYQNIITFVNTKSVPYQQYFNFDNGSFQSNFDVVDSTQSFFEFDNFSHQSNIVSNKTQSNFIFDSGSQYNSTNLIISQQNVTIKGFNRDVIGLTVDENGVYIIHDLPTKTTSKLIGKVNNELIEVDNLYYDGSKWVLDGTIHVNTISATTYQNLPNTTFTGGTVTGATSFTNGLTANTFSAGTYYNLPVSGVTGGTGISANTTNGLVTIVNTAPDQVVTITGGTNININGTYPNFGINFTGSTGASGDFLPLSGGTVSGATIFTSGLTANTISATTYQNLPVSGVTGGTGISAITSDGLVTIVNTSPDQIVTLSGGTGISTGGTYPNFVLTNTAPDQIVTISGNTGISTGGTYPNFVLTNTAPDQVVTITGGTNISVNGSYPNFGVSVTGITNLLNNYLPLSGGTVTGATSFTNGLTANTISATTYQNLPATPFLPLSGGTVTGATSFTSGLTANTISATTYQNLQNSLKTFNRTQGIYYFEEFMGNNSGSVATSYNTVITLSSGNATARSVATTNRTNQQGIIQHSTGTGASNFTGYAYGSSLYIGSGTISLETYLTVETLSTVTERFMTYFGYAGGSSNYLNIPSGIFFSYDEGGVQFSAGAATPNWKCYTRVTGGTVTLTTTSVPVVAAQWYKLRIDINSAGNSVTFYIDNTLVATHTTNIPSVTTAIAPISIMNKTIGTSARTMLTDYFMYEEIFTNAR